MRRIATLILFIGITFSILAAGTYSGGSGTSGSPYQIATTADIIELSNTSADWSAYFIQTADIAFNADETQVDWDGDGTATWDTEDQAGFSPIGNTTTIFTGFYDGQNYEINNLFINRPTETNVGFFGHTESPSSNNELTIQNIGITNADVTGELRTAGLIGYVRFSKISNCYSTGSVESTGSGSGWSQAGGLVGRTNGSIIENCYSTATVTGNGYRNGGLVAQMWSDATYPSQVSNSYSTGDVYGSSSYGGGLVGIMNGGTINNSYATGDIHRLTGESNTNMGAFVGGDYNEVPTITNCYCTGSVYYDGTSNPSNKGFCGESVSASSANNFFDSELSNQSTATGATGKTTAEMKTLATFTDETTEGLTTAWDFVTDPNDDVGSNDYWDMDESGFFKSGYPYLYWEDGDDQSLPVELASFTANAGDAEVILRWVTESEINNEAFLLERSTDGETFELLAEIEGQGTKSEQTQYEYTDRSVYNGQTYHYRLADRDYNGVLTQHKTVTATPNVDGVQKVSEAVIKEYTLFPAYPNPFNPETMIRFNVPTVNQTVETVNLTVYNMLGQKVVTLYDGPIAGGSFEMKWNGKSDSGVQQPSGVYLIHFRSEQFVRTRKITLLR